MYLPKNANGLKIIVHETEPMAKIQMFIEGKYTYWVEFDLPQMNGMIETLQRKVKEMEQNRDALT
jgi:hypothetical protein